MSSSVIASVARAGGSLTTSPARRSTTISSSPPSVCLIDVVTNRHFNLYSELIEFLGLPTPQVAGNADAVYAVSIRPRQRRRKLALRAWAVPLAPGQPLPTLPLWLTESLWVPLELEASYEDTCRIFRLPPPATLPA